MADAGVSLVTGTRVGSALVVTLGRDLGGATLEHLTKVALDGIQHGGASAVIVDVTGVPFMDAAEFRGLQGVLRMAALLGARTMLVGLQPGIIMHLMDCDVDTSGLHAVFGLDEALQSMELNRDATSG